MMTARQITVGRQQLQDYFEECAAEFGRSERRYWCGKYLEGLLREGERKSIEPLATRVGGDDQALQQFVSQSAWDQDAVMFRLRALMLRRAIEGGVAQVPGNIAAWPMEALATVAQADRGRPAQNANPTSATGVDFWLFSTLLEAQLPHNQELEFQKAVPRCFQWMRRRGT